MTIWSIHSNITNLVTAPFIERRVLCPIAILARNLLFWHVQINQCAEPTLNTLALMRQYFHTYRCYPPNQNNA